LEQERDFDDLFFQFFLPARRREPAKQTKLVIGDGEENGETAPRPKTASPDAPTEWAGEASGQVRQVNDEDTEAGSARQFQALLSHLHSRYKDEVRISTEDLAQMLQAASALVSKIRLGKSRRWSAAARGPRLFFRRTIRKSLQTGGEAMHPAWLAHRHRTPRFVVLLDGSRSMQAHSDRLLQFAYALRMRCSRVEVFVFSTSLKRITRELGQSVRERPGLCDLGESWGGGTRIGDCLARFERIYGGMLRRDTVVLIASDGLDTSQPEVLKQALHQIHLRSASLVWLNPLLELPGYDPQANTMQAALAYVDTFTFASRPEEFAALAKQIRLRL